MPPPIKTTWADKEILTNEDLNNNFTNLLTLNIYNEIPGGVINGVNLTFTTALIFRANSLRVYLSKPATSEGGGEYVTDGAARLFKTTNYTETLDINGNGTGFVMVTPVPGFTIPGQVLIVDYQRANV